ncbi:MAG: hypothetical protein H6906_10455 [Hyphomicrobiales bacterium]|nr:hypothetical protein [Hyphomicrobiales bacterium]
MARIIVVGSVALDQVVCLDGPLVPGTHMEARDSGARLGGGGANTALPLAAAGHAVTLCSGVGTDGDSDRLLADLTAAGIDTALVTRQAGGPTRSLVMVDPGGERSIVNLRRVQGAEPFAGLARQPADWIYVRSRADGLAPVLAARAADTRVVAHVPPCGPGLRPAHVLVGSAADLDPAFLADPFAAGRAVAGAALEWVVVTRGAVGAEAHGPDGILRQPAVPARAVDSTGAGDAFAAGLVHALATGSDMAGALATGAAFGAAAVEQAASALPAAAVRGLVA